MTTVVLDPGLLAFVESISKDELLEKIERLVTWSKIQATRPWIKLVLPPSTRTYLEHYNLIPAHEAAKQLLQATSLRNVYSPEDIIRPVYQLLEQVASTGYCCVSDELHENFNANPEQPWHGGNAGVEGLSQRALLMSSLENRIHEESKFKLFASIIRSDQVDFVARLLMVEPESAPSHGVADLPCDVADTLKHVTSIEDLCSLLEPEEIWAKALSASDVKIAIQLACRKRMIEAGNHGGLDQVPVFFVGAEFLESLKKWQADGRHRFAAQTLESCAAAVLNLPTIEIKVFDKAQRVADRAMPLRAHISKSGVGLRLMMWDRPRTPRCLEFANVGGKHEEEIAYSNPSEAV